MMRLTRPRRAGGFSIVEMMVAVTVGLLAIMFATRLIVGAEKNKTSSLGGSDQMQNGMLALFSINGDAAQAGWGLNDELLVGCDTTLSDTDGYTLASATRGAATITPLAPVVITNSATGSDQLSLYSGSASSGVGSVKVRSTYLGADALDIDTQAPFGFASGDVVVVAPEPSGGGNCAVAQLSADPLTSTLAFASGGAARFNSGTLGGNAYTAGRARVFNLGPARNLSLHTWSVQNGVLLLRASNLAGATTAGSAVVDNIVALKAQYGFDTRADAIFSASAGMQVSQWSNTMIDADGLGGVGSAGDYRRVAAVRIAVVARSAAPEKPGSSGVCSATSTLPTAFAAASPAGVAAAPVTVSVAITGDPVDWKCYRYRVFETIVPIRNAGWRPA
ncbi:PilW family protein [Pseudoduganella namucuonensis]|uniref:Type IV pilus assembly protein PilW n=1 Tax=Pseudoduganella namucuonensis TaxID=1035707 RepID=A0A1I7HRQ5_9BURK|nr:PilW family protein [Pseudoduganella namucuonensis]SFU63343.1 type IV pilus assembly protein PilW [Pseudoduganella namucuonensis]